MVVGFTATCTISAFHHYSCEFEPCSCQGVLGTTSYMIKFVSDLRQVGGFLRGHRDFSTNKTDRLDITEILLKVALNSFNQPTIFFLFRRGGVEGADISVKMV